MVHPPQTQTQPLPHTPPNPPISRLPKFIRPSAQRASQLLPFRSSIAKIQESDWGLPGKSAPWSLRTNREEWNDVVGQGSPHTYTRDDKTSPTSASASPTRTYRLTSTSTAPSTALNTPATTINPLSTALGYRSPSVQTPTTSFLSFDAGPGIIGESPKSMNSAALRPVWDESRIPRATSIPDLRYRGHAVHPYAGPGAGAGVGTDTESVHSTYAFPPKISAAGYYFPTSPGKMRTSRNSSPERGTPASLRSYHHHHPHHHQHQHPQQTQIPHPYNISGPIAIQPLPSSIPPVTRIARPRQAQAQVQAQPQTQAQIQTQGPSSSPSLIPRSTRRRARTQVQADRLRESSSSFDEGFVVLNSPIYEFVAAEHPYARATSGVATPEPQSQAQSEDQGQGLHRGQSQSHSQREGRATKAKRKPNSITIHPRQSAFKTSDPDSSPSPDAAAGAGGNGRGLKNSMSTPNLRLSSGGERPAVLTAPPHPHSHAHAHAKSHTEPEAQVRSAPLAHAHARPRPRKHSHVFSLTAQTICDAFVLPRPRLRAYTTSVVQMTPPHTPLVVAENGDGAAGDAEMGVVGGGAGGARVRRRSTGASISSSCMPSIRRPRMGKRRDTAPPVPPLPIPGPRTYHGEDEELSRVIAEGEMFAEERAKWAAQAEGSFANKRSRTHSRRGRPPKLCPTWGNEGEMVEKMPSLSVGGDHNHSHSQEKKSPGKSLSLKESFDLLKSAAFSQGHKVKVSMDTTASSLSRSSMATSWSRRSPLSKNGGHSRNASGGQRDMTTSTSHSHGESHFTVLHSPPRGRKGVSKLSPMRTGGSSKYVESADEYMEDVFAANPIQRYSGGEESSVLDISKAAEKVMLEREAVGREFVPMERPDVPPADDEMAFDDRVTPSRIGIAISTPPLDAPINMVFFSPPTAPASGSPISHPYARASPLVQAAILPAGPHPTTPEAHAFPAEAMYSVSGRHRFPPQTKAHLGQSSPPRERVQSPRGVDMSYEAQMSEIAHSASPFGLIDDDEEKEEEEDAARVPGGSDDDPTLTLTGTWKLDERGSSVLSPAQASSNVAVFPFSEERDKGAESPAVRRRTPSIGQTLDIDTQTFGPSASKYSPPIEQILSESDQGTQGSRSSMHNEARRREYRRTASSSTLRISSAESSPKATPRTLGSPSDLEGFRDLFYVPSPRPVPSVPSSPQSDNEEHEDVERASSADELELSHWTGRSNSAGSIKGLQLMIDTDSSPPLPTDLELDDQEFTFGSNSLPSLERYSEANFRLGYVDAPLLPSMIDVAHKRVSAHPSLFGSDEDDTLHFPSPTSPSAASRVPRPHSFQFLRSESPGLMPESALARTSFVTATDGSRISGLIQDFPVPPTPETLPQAMPSQDIPDLPALPPNVNGKFSNPSSPSRSVGKRHSTHSDVSQPQDDGEDLTITGASQP
ncbi:hypothetical protein BOTBODRAFT_180689 [Botryobasidium botryosum FD-172 SS1]|uniref:Uncharacterized protein n=1 Tax=Botryobasidium botryosum (strain FD-172 SS1) TaxID=930990 RepID=A0A067LYH6_BOTB1|nr:hypothetical protein BOTBODRAFT_180689 [Botryobasidium botryosum FD-172 SS1]